MSVHLPLSLISVLVCSYPISSPYSEYLWLKEWHCCSVTLTDIELIGFVLECKMHCTNHLELSVQRGLDVDFSLCIVLTYYPVFEYFKLESGA